MRFGITILPEVTWSEAAPRWRAAEELGFDHAWTYDHLVWAGLPDSPWFGTTPTLTAAALVTARMRLGTFVTSPNYRHPVAFTRGLLALDDISRGRFILGLGTGGDRDAKLLGGPELTMRQRVARFHEFVELLDVLLTRDHVDFDGVWFRSVDARTLPGPVQRPRIPFVIAANGPKSLRLAARRGQGWVTYGSKRDTEEQWWETLRDLSSRLDEALVAEGRDAKAFERHLNLDGGGWYALESVDRFEEMVGRASGLGFTDVITHWPRPESPYAGSTATLETVATQVIPRLRGATSS